MPSHKHTIPPTSPSAHATSGDVPPPMKLNGNNSGGKKKSGIRKPRQREERPSRNDDEIQDRWTRHTPTPGLSLRCKKERQRESWDCGVACAQMVLGVLGGVDNANPSRRLLMPRLAGTSLWTIDLAYLLTEYGVECQYVTAMSGIQGVDEQSYAASSFYAKTLAVDAVRVNRLFRAAERERVDVRTRRLSAAQLWAVMCEEETLVVALVDARRLPWASAEAAESTSQFVGHFVLLLAVDEDRGGYIVTDPGAEEERCFVHFQDLEAARRADGTDEDLLLIPAFQSPPTPPPPGAKPKIARVCEEESVGEMREAENEATEAADRWSRWMESVRGGSSSAGNSGAPARAVPMPLMRTRSRTRSFDSDERLSGASIPELELEASPMDDVPARPLSSGGMSRLRPIKSGVELNHMDDDPGADIAAGHWPGQISPRMSPRGQAPWVLT